MDENIKKSNNKIKDKFKEYKNEPKQIIEDIKNIPNKISRAFNKRLKIAKSKFPTEKCKLFLNIFLVIEILAFVGFSVYKKSIVTAFMDAFSSTTVGGLYSFLEPLVIDPSHFFENLDLSDYAIGMWIFSGLSYMALAWFNSVIEDLDYNRFMRVLHSIFFTLTFGSIGIPIAIIVVWGLMYPIQPLWQTGSFFLRIIAALLTIIVASIVIKLISAAFKSLIETLLDIIKLYTYAFKTLLVLLIVVPILEKLKVLYALDKFAYWIATLLHLNIQISDTFIIDSPNAMRIFLALFIFFMYNVSALKKGEEIVI